VAGCEAEGTAFPLSTLHENRMTKMTSTTTTLAATTYLRCRYRRVKAASFDKPIRRGAPSMVRAAEEPHWRTRNPKGGLADFSRHGRRVPRPRWRQRPARGRGLLRLVEFVVADALMGRCRLRTSGTCVAGAATARTADGRFSGLVVGALSNSVSTAGVACPALIGVTPGKAAPCARAPTTKSLRPPQAWRQRQGLTVGLWTRIQESAAAPLWGLSQESAAAPPWDRIRNRRGTALGPEPGADGANLRPEPACGNFGPEPEAPVGKDFGLEPGARFPDPESAGPCAGRSAARNRRAALGSAHSPVVRRRSPQITDFLGDNRNILGPFPAIHAFLPDTDRLFWLERHDDLRRIGAAERPCSRPSTATNHSRRPEGGRESPMRGVQPMQSRPGTGPSARRQPARTRPGDGITSPD